MDQIKIGKYIAEKRKALGLTQLQLAEKLDMSNKSVSKWERGVCLPDVAVYTKLCNALGISLNEFLAGEDLSTVEMIPKSEETIIEITKEKKKRKKRTQQIISLLVVIILLISGIALYFLNKEGVFYRNCIVPLSWKSEESKAADLICDEGANLYRYYADKTYNQIQVKYYRYKEDELVEEGILKSYYLSGNYSGEGMMAIVHDYDSGELHIKIHVDGSDYEYGGDEIKTVEYKLPLEGMDLYDWQELMCAHIQIPYESVKLEDGEAGVLYIVYDKDMPDSMPKSIEKDGFWPKGAEVCNGIEENDYTDFITVKFNEVK